jgi:hypothetical protein
VQIVLSDEARTDCAKIRNEKLRLKLKARLKRYSDHGIGSAEKNVKQVSCWDGEMRYRLKLNGERVLFYWSEEHDSAYILRIFSSHDDYERHLQKTR